MTGLLNPFAFPVTQDVWATNPDFHGMTLRDYFAGQALANPAICTGTAPDYQLASWFGNYANSIMRDQIVAKQAYAHADAMLAGRTTRSFAGKAAQAWMA